jgi:hypothetical protein
MPALSTMHHDRGSLSPTSLYLLLHVRSVLDILAEVANVASDLLVRLERERDNGHEAEGEPFPALHYLSSVRVGYVRGGGVGLTRPEKLPQF